MFPSVIADLLTCHIIYVKIYIYVTYVLIQPCGLITYMSHICKKLRYRYVLIHPHGFTYMSHTCTYIYIYVTNTWTSEMYVT